MSNRLSGLIVCIALFLGLSIPGHAGDNGGIPEKLIDQLRRTPLTETQRVTADIVAGQNISDVALNREKFIGLNKYINTKIKTGDITNQKGSGRCWIFAGLNVLRPQAMKNLKIEKFEFSQNYLMFWDKLEKFNTFIQYMIDFADRPLDDREIQIIIDGPGGDGGWWSYFTGLIDKYGLVPNDVMPETYNSSASGKMNEFLEAKAKQIAVGLRQDFAAGISKQDLEKKKQERLSEIYNLLVYYLGQPPSEFEWRYESADTTVKGTITRTFTPQSFAKAAIIDNLDDYVALFNYPGKEFFENYGFEMSRNIYEDPDFSLVNVPVDTMIKYSLASLLDSTPVWFACDVGKENYRKDGVMALDIYNYESLLGTTFDLPKKDLIQMMVITPNHAMVFMGVDTANGQTVKWLVENSWGADGGDKGYWYMYDDWYRKYMFGVILHKRYLSGELIKIAESKPQMLLPWDPMYSLTRLQ